jgi:hypothetical protein
MKYKQHRVMGRTADGSWEELYQGRVGECRKYIEAMRLRDRKVKTPVVTRRSVQEWLNQTTPLGNQAASSCPSMKSASPTHTPGVCSLPTS